MQVPGRMVTPCSVSSLELDTYIWSWRATLALAFTPYQCAAVHLSAPIPALLSNSSPLGMLTGNISRLTKQQFSVQKQMRETFSLLDLVEARDHLRQVFPYHFFLSSPLRAVSHFSPNHLLLPILVHDSCRTSLNVPLFLLFLFSHDLSLVSSAFPPDGFPTPAQHLFS